MTPLQQQILDAALRHAVFDGWTMATLEATAREQGLSAFDVKRAFPGGVTEALALHSARVDAQMVEILRRDFKLTEMKIRERIATAVMVRLRLLAPEREAMRRAVGFYTMPWNTAAGLKTLYETVDAMWREAGDTSTDYNFYTKRLLLAGVYKTTFGVWLEDATPELTVTEAFLRRRIENVMQIEKAKAGLRERTGKFEEWLPGFLRKRA